ncbi:hypothetical protein ACTMTI_34490 [Nonomuraea sp. H19]|uniref:hypothetical protein n=1 Tax=Nonomuraea sp. H19 TaxID=3452206 RepID=UPI003F8BDFFB
MTEPRLDRGPKVQLGGEILEGLAFVLGHPLLRRIAGCTATLNLFTSMAGPVLLMLPARELGLAAGTIGLIMAASGLGGVLAETIGIRSTILVAVGLGCLAFLWVITSPLRTIRPQYRKDARTIRPALGRMRGRGRLPGRETVRPPRVGGGRSGR